MNAGPRRIVLWMIAATILYVLAARTFGRLAPRDNNAADRAAYAQGRAAGATLLTTQCADSALTAYAADTTTRTRMRRSFTQGIYLQGCLETTRDLPTFCRGYGHDVTDYRVLVSVCAQHGLHDSYCPQLLNPLASACGKLRSPARG